MSELNPQISVVIPTYNCEKYVGAAIESALSQTQPPLEVIVVDDGSTDETPRLLKTYGDQIVVVRQENSGLSAARNRGILEAKGDWIATLDSDDLFHPRKLERQSQALRNYSSVDVIGCGHFEFESDGANFVTPAWSDLPDHEPPITIFPLKLLWARPGFPASSALIRRSALEKTGWFDTQLRSAEDMDMWIRIVEQGGQSARVDEPLLGYRLLSNSMSTNAKRMEDALRTVHAKIDQRRGWGRGWIDQRVARSYVAMTCAYTWRKSGHPGQAVTRMLRSFAWWPFPSPSGYYRESLTRPRLLFGSLLEWMKVKRFR